MEFGYTEIGVALLLSLVALIFVGGYKLHSRAGSKYLKRMLAGKLYDDYANNHEEAVINGKLVCYSCKSEKIWVQLVIRRLDKSVSEHKCRGCGTFLFYSYTGFDPEKL